MGWQECLSLEYLGDSQEALKRFVAANPVLAPAIFVLIYAVVVAFSFPAASILTIFSGFLFGWLAGGVLRDHRRDGRRDGAVPCRPHGVWRLPEGARRERAPRNLPTASRRTPSATCSC